MSSKSCNFRNREAHGSNITFSHFQNPFNFYTLMFLPMQQLISWLMDNHLLKSMMCEKCGKECKLSHRKNKIDDFTWRCRNIKQHHDRKDFERSIRQYSFFIIRISQYKIFSYSSFPFFKNKHCYNVANCQESITNVLP